MILRPQLRFDLWLMLAPFGLVVVGILLIYSASFPQELAGDPWQSPAARHGFYALIGFSLLAILSRIDYRFSGHFAVYLYVAAMLLLVAVLFIGESVNGVRRWVDLRLFLLQPSEIAKLVVVVVLARFFSQFRQDLHKPHYVALSLAIVALPMGLVYLQPDLGTAVVFAGIWWGMAIIAGMRLIYLVGLFASAAAAIPILFNYVLHGYMQQRLYTFLDPALDPLGAGYNILQSEISVGSGGLLGKGLLNGTQSQLHFLRVQQTDFIFSVLGEELGFLGAALVFALFVLLLLRALRTAVHARDDYGRLLAAGIVMMVLTQVFINVGVNVRLLPVTGIPLPFLSFGGSSLITMLLAVGLLQSIYVHRQRADW